MVEMESLVARHGDNSSERRATRHHGPALLLISLPFVLMLLLSSDRLGLFSSQEISTTKKLVSWLADDAAVGAAHQVRRGTTDTSKTTVQVHSNDGTIYNVSERTALQIEHYRRGAGLMLNVHITHHGGTTLCHLLGHSPDAIGRTPSFACMRDENMMETTGYDDEAIPWNGKLETAQMIPLVRQHFHFISWEFGWSSLENSLNETDWENPNLLSILVMRDPISRLLAGDGWVAENYPNIDNGKGTHKDWWGYANDTWFTNNYALRVLGGDGCCSGAETDPMFLEKAKALVERVSIVLDIECLNEGIDAIANLLNIRVDETSEWKRNTKVHRAPAKDRIGYDDVYDYLVEKNRLDIELYEWSKSRALIKCS